QVFGQVLVLLRHSLSSLSGSCIPFHESETTEPARSCVRATFVGHAAGRGGRPVRDISRRPRLGTTSAGGRSRSGPGTNATRRPRRDRYTERPVLYDRLGLPAHACPSRRLGQSRTRPYHK